jgi:hypothetical protein
MTRHTGKPLDRLRLDPTNEPLIQLVHQLQRRNIFVDAPYQRGPVWTLDQRIAFMMSVLTGTPLPTIIANRRPKTGMKRWIIDGKQRIETARQWFESELAVPATWFDASDVVDPIDLAPGSKLAKEYGDTGLYVYYGGLCGPAQLHIEMGAHIPVHTGYLPGEREEADVYLRVNLGGTPQTVADLDRARRVKDGTR